MRPAFGIDIFDFPAFGIDIFNSLAKAMAFKNKSTIPIIYYGSKYGTTG